MYSFFITKLTNVRKHPNADRLQLATVMGEQVIVGMENHDGELGVYYPTDGKLSHENLLANDLYSKSARQQLGLEASDKVGYFDHHGRVRAQSFRGQKSDGIWLPISTLYWALDSLNIDPLLLNDGAVFNDIPAIASKYITKATKANSGQQRSTKRGETVMFKKHVDTDQFAYYYQDIPVGSIITLTEKLHGTSGRYGYVKETQPNGWFKRLFGLPKRSNWTMLSGTRNVIIEHSNGQGYYESDQFREQVLDGLTLRKGETVYGELVGYTTTGQEIMPSQPIPKDLKELKQQYGDAMNWHYSCAPGQSQFYVYRITQTNEDGQSVELSWAQTKRRCVELSLQHVPELGNGPFIFANILPDQDHDMLNEYVNEFVDGPSLIDPSQIREGVALRIDTPDGRTYWLKHKSFSFKVLEGIIKLNDEYVDNEEVA